MLDAAAVTWRNDLRSILISSSLSKHPFTRPAVAGKRAVAGHALPLEGALRFYLVIDGD
jgi:hypothetical protein